MKKRNIKPVIQSREEQVLSLAVIGLVAVLVALMVTITTNGVLTQIEDHTNTAASANTQ